MIRYGPLGALSVTSCPRSPSPALYSPRLLPWTRCALSSRKAPASVWSCGTCPPHLRTQRRAHPRPPCRRLRHRPPHLGVGQLGQQPAQAAGRHRSRVRRARSSSWAARPRPPELLAVGDLVTAEGHIVCGHCLQCRLGAATSASGPQIIGVDRDGAFADFIAMPASNVMKLDGIPTEIGAIMDPMGNAVHTVLEAAGARQHRPRARLRPDRLLRGRRGTGRRRLAGHRERLQPDAARAGPARWARTSRSIPARTTSWPGCASSTDGDGVDLVCEMSGHPERPRAGVRGRATGRTGQPAGHAQPDHRGGLRPGRDLQGAHPLRRHRPQDVRDLAPDAPLPPGRPARPPPRHHPPLPARVHRRGDPGHQGRPGRARSFWRSAA